MRLATLSIWILSLLGAAAPSAHALDHGPRWQNEFSVDTIVLLGDTGAIGVKGSWFFHKYMGVTGIFSGFDDHYTGSLLFTARFMHRGLVFGLFGGPMYGSLKMEKDLDSGDTVEYTSRGLFLEAGPFVGYRFESGVHVAFSLHRYFGIHTRESLDQGDKSSTFVGLSGGFHFSSLGTIIGAGRAGSLISRFSDSPDVTTGRPSPKPMDNRFSWSLGAGTGTPLGHLFAELSYAPVPELEIAVGGGWGTAGPAAGAMARFRSIDRYSGRFMYVGTGGSWGTQAEILFRKNHPIGEEEFVIKNALYANVEIGYGMRYESGVTLRLFAGLTTVLNPLDGECITNCTHTSAGGTVVPTTESGKFGRAFAYVGLALGPSF